MWKPRKRTLIFGCLCAVFTILLAVSYTKLVMHISSEQVKNQYVAIIKSMEQSYIREVGVFQEQIAKDNHLHSRNTEQMALMVSGGGGGGEWPSLLRRMEANLNDLWTFGKTLELNESQRHYLYDWYRLMSVYVTEVSTFTSVPIRAKQQSLKVDISTALEKLQKPQDCSASRKLLCDGEKSCGFGCLMHHFSYCLITAMALNRTLLLTKKPARILPFTPFTADCEPPEKFEHWQSLTGDQVNQAETIKLSLIDWLPFSTHDSFMPQTIPGQLRKRLEEVSQMPFVFFLGHILAHIMRPTKVMEQKIAAYQKQIGLRGEDYFVGVHVRRTDKLIAEAKHHSLREYMVKVAEIYDRLDMHEQFKRKVEEGARRLLRARNVYLATDDETVWRNETAEFVAQGYRFFGDVSIARNAVPDNRDTKQALEQLVLDIWMLSMSDHLVCTFSSQICRLAFELMQAKQLHGFDMSLRAHSIDDLYYFGGQVCFEKE